MATVTFDHVRKMYGDVNAVDDLNLEIHDGEFMVLVGPSGCGKTTSLRMIAGLEDITDGTLRIGDRVVNDVPPKDRDIAMVFQSYALYPHMTVRDNLAFGLKLRKMPKEEIERRVNEAAEHPARALLDRKPKELSGGQRQRVALGRAIVREPAVFLMDEPLSNLDAKLRVQTRAEIARLHQRLKTTIVYVTHDQVEAMTMGNRIAVMSEGVFQQVGSPQELYDIPINRFVAGFIGSPSMNFIDVALEGSGDERQAGRARRCRSRSRPATARRSPRPASSSSPASGRSTSSSARRAGQRRRSGHAPTSSSTSATRSCSTSRGRPGPRRDRRLRASGQAGRQSRWTCRSTSSTCSTPRPVSASRPDAAAAAGPTSRPRRRAPASAPRDPSGADLASASSTPAFSTAVDTSPSGSTRRADRRLPRQPATSPGIRAPSRSSRIDDEDRVLLVRQFRHPAGEVLLEIPAGTLDSRPTGAIEDPDLAAPRELEEETGMRAGSWRLSTLLDGARVRDRVDASVLRHGPRPADGDSRPR